MPIQTEKHTKTEAHNGHDFSCHEENRSCRITQGPDFDYCPFCGDEL